MPGFTSLELPPPLPAGGIFFYTDPVITDAKATSKSSIEMYRKHIKHEKIRID
jgi:hypothetical protein